MDADLQEQISNMQIIVEQKLCELEARASEIQNLIWQSPNFIPEQCSSSSFKAVDSDTPPPKEPDWDKLNEMILTQPEDAVFEMITYIRYNLDRKASTKRMTEKANCQYVDGSFQRVATQVTAMVNQSIHRNHITLENEVNEITNYVEELKENLTHEFDDIRQMITDCKKVKAEMKKEEYQAALNQSQTRGRFYPTSSQRQRNSKTSFEGRKSSIIQRAFSATLTNSMTKAKPVSPE